MTNCKVCSDGQTCQTCQDPSATPVSLYVDQTTNPHTCTQCNQDERYPSGLLCLSCGSNCAKCSDDSSCLECSNPSTMHPLEGTTPVQCGVCSLLTGRYLEGQICKQCPPQCSSCVSASECTRCAISAEYLQTDKISCSGGCGSGEFKNSVDMKCETCPPGCSGCTSSTECTSCSNNLHYLGLDLLTCAPDCDGNSYKNDSNMKCVACPAQCSGCSSSTSCSGCKDSSLLLIEGTTRCEPSCPQDYTQNDSTKTCRNSQCPSQCSSCDSQNRCLGCKDPSKFLHPDMLTCASDCPVGLTKDSEEMKCKEQKCAELPNCIKIQSH